MRKKINTNKAKTAAKAETKTNAKSQVKAKADAKAGAKVKTEAGTENRSLLVNLTKNGHFKSYFKLCEPALKSLLKAFLPLPKNTSIKSVNIVDSLLPTLKREDKNSIMDLRLQLNTEEFVNVEMQAFPHKDFTKRILFYWAKNYISQLKEGESYITLHPSYSLIFTTFDLFPVKKGKFYNSFSIRSDAVPHFSLNQDLRFVTVELSKFKSGDLSSLIALRDIWCYILKSSESIGEREYKNLSDKDPEMGEAMTYLRKFSAEEQQQILMDAKERNRMDREAREAYVFDTGVAEGIEKGMEKLVLNMLKNGISLNLISKCTGWSEKKIKQIRDK